MKLGVLEMGKLIGIFISNGGVPKLPIESAQVETTGIIGDACNNKKHHQTLSLMVLERSSERTRGFERPA